jgi:hypothetical protein
MQKTSIENQLVLAEQQLDAAVLSLQEGHGPALVQASERLKATAVGLVQLMNSARATSVKSEHAAKIGELAQRLISLRENLIRRSAYVERALKVVMPVVEKTTYQTRGPYGSSLRSAGAMNVTSA